ncbi:uracil-DNA glycosylase [Halocatena pleomorpha]|uniref:Type-4 uracil-DNA glycosylase n=1 Tax=Halocatena pleomorpha TaxID=1785090 RepID=A0A3P3R703_9EURY|nr:uracil-DNA glycosylase [Halocatena pleomorpha]RRJ29135.1 uracil-DNA glycosylase [Halocatena pleomorpha]
MEQRTDGIDVLACEQCPELCESRSRIVNGTGTTSGSILFVGEGPGANEDERGEPFVGRSGDVLDAALRDRGFTRRDVRITNCVRCRPPDNRDPTANELENCRVHLHREIEQIDPELIVTLGKVPSQHLLERDVAVTNEAGSVVEHRIAGSSRRVVICVHPAATLYDSSQQDAFEGALDEAISIVGHSAGGQSRLSEY